MYKIRRFVRDLPYVKITDHVGETHAQKGRPKYINTDSDDFINFLGSRDVAAIKFPLGGAVRKFVRIRKNFILVVYKAL